MKKIYYILPFAFLLLLSGCKENEESKNPSCPSVEVHEHTFSDVYSYDETNHWHNANCEHTYLTKDLNNHTFDSNNKCSVCGYERVVEPEPHVHTFKSEWSKNETSHWHNADCEHTEITSSLEEHTFNEQNVCSVCGYERVVEPTKYTITFIDEMNKNSTNIFVEEDKTIAPIDDPAFEGYTFNGWVDKDNNSFGLKNSNTWNSYFFTSNAHYGYCN